MTYPGSLTSTGSGSSLLEPEGEIKYTLNEIYEELTGLQFGIRYLHTKCEREHHLLTTNFLPKT